MAIAGNSDRNISICACIAGVLLLSAAPASAGWLDDLKDRLGVGESSTQSLSTEEVGRGLKEALRVGTETVVSQLGAKGGFNLDPEIRIPLPGQLDKVKEVLGKVGMDSMLTDLDLRINRAAEIATPKAQALFMQAIDDMTLDDVMGIYQGPNDAATQYFKRKMSGPLAVEMKPVVDQSLGEVGAVSSYNAVMARYNAVPFAPEVDADLGDYVVEKGMDGIFYYLAREEAAIREDPAARTTELLKQVFGAQQ